MSGLALVFLLTAVKVQAQPGGKREDARKVEYRGHKANKAFEKYDKKRRKAEKEYHKERVKEHKRYHKKNQHHTIPSWGAKYHYKGDRHVYFKSHQTFYDARRNGYVYQQQGRWVFTPKMPAFLVNVQLGPAQVQILQDVPLYRAPELYHRR